MKTMQSTHSEPPHVVLGIRRRTTSKSIPLQLFPAKVPFKGLVKSIVRKCSHAHLPHFRIRTVSPSRHPDTDLDTHYTEPISFRASVSTLSSVPSLIQSENSSSMSSEGSQQGSTPEPGPPDVYIEPEVPDPFLIDDEGSASGGEEDEHGQVVAATEPQRVLAPAASPPLNRNKDVPPPPADSDDDESEAPELYLPGLCVPTMFLPIPNTDPLTTLVNKYIHPPTSRPVRDLNGEWQRTDFHTLVMSNSWRKLAHMARDRIVTSDPEDLNLILSLWNLRLSSLARMRLFNQTTAECTNLFTLLNSIEPPSSRQWLFDHVLPFELEVMHSRIKFWTGDHMGYVDELCALLRKCKTRSRRAKSDSSMWKERGARVCLILSSQLVEMKDFSAATKLLEPLCRQDAVPAMRSAVARIYLQAGNLAMAAQYFAQVADDPSAHSAMKLMNAALLAAAEGDWEHSTELLRSILREDAENYVAVNNLCVTLLSQGKLKEGIEVMERALKAHPESVVVAEPFLFNLSTLYELRSTTAIENKQRLLIEVAKWSGDGLKTACLKMPSN